MTTWKSLTLTVLVVVVINVIHNCLGVTQTLVSRQQAEHHLRIRRQNPETLTKSSPVQQKCSNSKKRMFKLDGKCYAPGSKGPCGKNMLFHAYANNDIYGDCDCSPVHAIPLVYNFNNSKCYEVYQQGYCDTNQWLVFDEEENATCEERKCPVSEKKMVFYNEKCVELLANDKTCSNPAERVRFPKDELHPRCAAESNSDFSIGIGATLQCSPGYSLDISGKCRKKVKFTSNGSRTPQPHSLDDRPSALAA